MGRFQKVAALDGTRAANQSLMYVRQLWNMLVIARVMVRGALLRDESRGAHFKPDFPKRDDARFLKTTIARYDATTHEPQISYEAVDVSLIPPRERKYDTEKKAAAPTPAKKTA
jgi:succinate dehydrogenase / fumarate reductase, flavoprotein subunit